MCRCTPNIRTPFCGKPGCEWPPRIKQKEFPSFDDWYRAKNCGFSFEDVHQVPGIMFTATVSALTRATRDYVTDMVRENMGANNGKV